jgi:hypothetical protein
MGMTSQYLVNRRTMDGWRDLVASKLDLKEGDMELVEVLAKNIMDRWTARASRGPAGPEKTMELIYRQERKQALAAIVAAVELIQTVGTGAVPRAYAELIKVDA